MLNLPKPRNNTRIGFHYFPDPQHFSNSDLNTWTPVLKSLGASWLVINTPLERVIPESFIKGVINEGIEPVLNFKPIIQSGLPITQYRLMFNTYREWGVNYLCIFNNPNSRKSWVQSEWAKSNLVDRFLDLYLPLAEIAIELGFKVITPPLSPGGDYWDLVFIRSFLDSLKKRNKHLLLTNLVLGVNANAFNRPLSWGAGGQDRWPNQNPYSKSEGEDHIGFHGYEWYQSISQSTLGKPLPLFLFNIGLEIGNGFDSRFEPVDEESHAHLNLQVAKMLLGDVRDIGPSEQLPEEIIGSSFWLLTTTSTCPYIDQGWIQPDGNQLLSVNLLQDWFPSARSTPLYKSNIIQAIPTQNLSLNKNEFQIKHYLLLPVFGWGISDWHLDIIKPFIKKHHPTIGFSINEASLAEKVTVIGGPKTFSPDDINNLRKRGTQVERITGDGTTIATKLNEL